MNDRFYITGGTLPPDAHSYVTRRADAELLDCLRAGEFCYVLNTRQVGKSSLMVRVAQGLRAEGVRVVLLDPTAIGVNVSVEEWYDGLLTMLAEQLGLRSQLEDFWVQHPRLGPLQRWMQALEHVALARAPEPLCIFVDEIDSVRSLPFSADEFFGGIRECYNRRAGDPTFTRLTFCLLGVATPSDLIRDTRVTPFNIGRRIELHDFTREEAAPLAGGLRPYCSEGRAELLLERVLHWTGGHPYMTQRLCRAVAESLEGLEQTGSGAGGKQDPRKDVALADSLCQSLFLTRTARKTDDNLAFVRTRLMHSETDRAALLDLYAQVRRGRRVKDDEANPLCPVLRLSGVVKAAGGWLLLRNVIYARVFDAAWIAEHMPDAEVRRQKRAYRLGVLRTAAGAALLVSLTAILAAYAFSERNHAQQNFADANKAKKRADDTAKRNAALATLLQAALQDALAKKAEAENQTNRAENLTARATKLQVAADAQAKTAKQAESNAERLQILAERRRQAAANQTAAAQQAEHREQIARRNESAQRQAAEHARYVSDVQLTAQTLRDGNTAKTLALLNAHIPGQGKNADVTNQREFTWRYQWGRLHAASITLKDAEGVPLGGAFTPGGKVIILNNRLRLSTWNPQTQRIEQTRRLAGPVCRLSADGQTVAWQDKSNRLLLQDVQTGRDTALSQENDPVRSLTFAQNGQWLLVIGAEGTASVWDVRRRARVSRMQSLQNVGFYGTPALFPDGSKFVLAGAGENGATMLYDARKPDFAHAALGSFPMYDITPTTAAISPNGALLAVGDYSGWVKVWNVNTRQILCELHVPARACVSEMAFAPDNDTLAVAKVDNQVHFYSVTKQSEIRLPAGHEDAITFLCWNRDSSALLSGSGDGTTRIWKTAPESEAQILPVTSHRTFHVLAPNGDLIAAMQASGEIAVWDRRSRRERARISIPGDRPSIWTFTPDSQGLAIGTWQRQVYVYDLSGAKPRIVFSGLDAPRFHSPIYAISTLDFSRDGRWLAAGVGTPANFGDNKGRAILWNVKTGNKIAELADLVSAVCEMRFSPDSKWLATCGFDNKVRLWQTGKWKHPCCCFAVPRLSGIGEPLTIAFAPNSRRIAAAGFRGPVGIYSVPDGAYVRTLIGHTSYVRGLSFAPDGRTLATGSEDATVKLWDMDSDRDFCTLTGFADSVLSVTFAAQGDALITCSNEDILRLWPAPLFSDINAQLQSERRRPRK